jgi:environmental stress-induced protein Ves
MVSPPGATLDSLDWRVSIATVASDGPFSVFKGVHRTLCVINGAGIRLQIADAPPITLLEHSAPYSFNGKATTSATLIDGAIVDLNVMSRRGRWRHTVKRMTCTDSLQLKVCARLIFVFCQRGEFQCTAGDESHDLATEDCAAIDGDVRLISLRAAEPAEVLVIEMFQEDPAAV